MHHSELPITWSMFYSTNKRKVVKVYVKSTTQDTQEIHFNQPTFLAANADIYTYKRLTIIWCVTSHIWFKHFHIHHWLVCCHCATARICAFHQYLILEAPMSSRFSRSLTGNKYSDFACYIICSGSINQKVPKTVK